MSRLKRHNLSLSLRTIPVAAYIMGGTLVVLSGVSWLVVAQASMPMTGTFDLSALILFTAIWAIGMVAMMFPPMIPVAYAVSQSSERGTEPQGKLRSRLVGPTLFILGYVGVWTIAGIGFYMALGLFAALGYSIVLGSLGLLGSGILIATGLYQFTRFKQNALMKCRSPMGFIMSGWRNGNRGALIMGGNYGLFCTKCCWVLMAGLLVVGAMSLPLMGVFAIIIFAEKIGPTGPLISKLVGVAFVLTGLFLIV